MRTSSVPVRPDDSSSGTAFQWLDQSGGTSVNQQTIRSLYQPKNCHGKLFAFCKVNLALQNTIKVFSTHNINVVVDPTNAFINKNYTGYFGNLGMGETYSLASAPTADRTAHAAPSLPVQDRLSFLMR